MRTEVPRCCLAMDTVDKQHTKEHSVMSNGADVCILDRPSYMARPSYKSSRYPSGVWAQDVWGTNQVMKQ